MWSFMGSFISKIIDFFFGCWHTHTSFPMTIKAGSRRSRAASMTGTYVVCLDCGREFAYDWQEMKIAGADADRGRAVHGLAPKEAA